MQASSSLSLWWRLYDICAFRRFSIGSATHSISIFSLRNLIRPSFLSWLCRRSSASKPVSYDAIKRFVVPGCLVLAAGVLLSLLFVETRSYIAAKTGSQSSSAALKSYQQTGDKYISQFQAAKRNQDIFALKDAEPIAFITLKFRRKLNIRLNESEVFFFASMRKDGEVQVSIFDRVYLYKIKQSLQAKNLSISYYFSENAIARLQRWEATEPTNLPEDNVEELYSFYKIMLPLNSVLKDYQPLITGLLASPLVEFAYANAQQNMVLSGSYSYADGKTFLSSGPFGGVNAEAAWSKYGKAAKGKDVNVIVVDQAWRKSHVNFPLNLLGFERINDTQLRNDLINQHEGFSEFWSARQESLPLHGNAVVGILAGLDNGIGMTGIAPNANIGLQTVDRLVGGGGDVCEALPYAIARAGYGGIVVVPIAKTYAGHHVPVEWDPACYSAIETAKAPGLNVLIVSSAGNIDTDLDDPIYQGLFDRSVRDSGAIIVAMSKVDSREPMPNSTYGSRIDAHAPGSGLHTIALDDTYTMFGGSSGAASVVGGALASIQAIAKTFYHRTLTYADMRNLINTEGIAQTHSLNRNIGRMPDIYKSAEVGLQRLFPEPEKVPVSSVLSGILMLLLGE